MGVVLLIILLIVIICIDVYVSEKFEKIAYDKGYGKEAHAFAMCFWLGIIGYLYVIALPDLRQRGVNQENIKNT